MARAAEIKERKPPARSSRRGLTRSGKVRAEPTAVYSRAGFCAAHGLSESFFHKLKNEGRGPDELRVGSRVFISFESAARWRAANEVKTAETPAFQEQEQETADPRPVTGDREGDDYRVTKRKEGPVSSSGSRKP